MKLSREVLQIPSDLRFARRNPFDFCFPDPFLKGMIEASCRRGKLGDTKKRGFPSSTSHSRVSESLEDEVTDLSCPLERDKSY